jgi:NADPH:quinone reductase-like Zn-dependent oxidoreductase
MAARAGARVLATARSPEAAEYVRGLGADDVVDYGDGSTDEPPNVTKIAHAAGDAADLATVLTSGGLLVSALGADESQIERKDVAVAPVMAQPTAQKMTALFDAVSRGDLVVPVYRTRSLEDSTSALDDFSKGKLGKVVVTIQ